MSELKTCFKRVDYDLSGFLHWGGRFHGRRRREGGGLLVL